MSSCDRRGAWRELSMDQLRLHSFDHIVLWPLTSSNFVVERSRKRSPFKASRRDDLAQVGMGFRLMSAGTNLKFFSTNRSCGEARAARLFSLRPGSQSLTNQEASEQKRNVKSKQCWKRAEAEPRYAARKKEWKARYG